MDMSLSKFQELVMDREAWCAAVHGITKSRTEQLNWAELNFTQHPDFPDVDFFYHTDTPYLLVCQ